MEGTGEGGEGRRKGDGRDGRDGGDGGEEGEWSCEWNDAGLQDKREEGLKGGLAAPKAIIGSGGRPVPEAVANSAPEATGRGGEVGGAAILEERIRCHIKFVASG